MGPAEAVLTVVLLGFAGAGLTKIVRTLVPVLWLLYKPLSCDLCMSFWAVVIVEPIWFASGSAPTLSSAVILALGAVSVAYLVTKRLAA